LIFDYEFIKDEPKEAAEVGEYIFGLYIEGTKWNYDTMMLDESDVGTLFYKIP
jgi:dynein heavy chain